MFDLLQEIGQTIRNNKLRTALTGVAVAWGVFMLIVLLGVARGLVNDFQADTASNARNNIRIWGGRTSMPYKGYKDGRWVQLKDGDMEDIAQSVDHISEGSSQAYASNFIVTGPKDYVAGSVSAVFPLAQKSERINKIKGRFINQADIDRRRRSIVISESTAEQIFENPDEALGSQVKGMGLSWTVVGIYPHEWQRTSFIPYSTYKAITGNDPYVGEIMFSLTDINSEEQALDLEEDIRTHLAKRHDFNPSDESAVSVWNQIAGHLSQGQGMIYLNIAVWVIGFLTLLTGIVGVSNIMFVSVKERVHEIGIRRAIGAKPHSIISQVLAESIAITTLFGYAGVVAGMGLLQLLKPILEDQAGFLNPTVDISIAIQVTIALIIAGALAGFFPAIKATKVKPVEALRDE